MTTMAGCWISRDLECILGIDGLEVHPIETFKKQTVLDDAQESKQLGLSLISEDRKVLISICLTTKSRIYVLNPNKKSHVTFLDTLLNRTDLRFFTIDGVWDADLIYTHTSIKLVQPIDLISFDIHLYIQQYIEQNTAPPNLYSITFIHDKVKPKQLNYEQLVSKWLGVELNLKISEQELEIIKKIPSDPSAGEIIRKRAALVRVLGMMMVKEFYARRDRPSKSLFSMALRASDNMKEDHERRGASDRSYADFCFCLSQCPPLNED